MSGLRHVELLDNPLDPHEICHGLDDEQCPGRLVRADVSVFAHERTDNLSHLGRPIVRQLEEFPDDLIRAGKGRQRLVRADDGMEPQLGVAQRLDEDGVIHHLGSIALHPQSAVDLVQRAASRQLLRRVDGDLLLHRLIVGDHRHAGPSGDLFDDALHLDVLEVDGLQRIVGVLRDLGPGRLCVIRLGGSAWRRRPVFLLRLSGQRRLIGVADTGRVRVGICRCVWLVAGHFDGFVRRIGISGRVRFVRCRPAHGGGLGPCPCFHVGQVGIRTVEAHPPDDRDRRNENSNPHDYL